MKGGDLLGLDLWTWLRLKLGLNVPGVTETDDDKAWRTYCAELQARELALLACKNLVGRALSKCEFKTFRNGKEVKEREYYLWNIEPNANQNSSAFLQKLVAMLFDNNEALVIEQNKQILVADDYSVKEFALYGDTFSNVRIGDFTFNKTFQRNEVMYFRLASDNARKVINCLYDSYKNLIEYSMKAYQRSRGEKGTLELEGLPTAGKAQDDFMSSYNELRKNGFKKFAESESAVMPLYKGMKYTSLSSKTYTQEGTRDIRAMIDDVTDFTARAYGIPPILVNGTVQDVASATDELLTFCIDPLVDTVQEEIIRQRYGYTEFSRGNYLQIDTKAIKHVDLLSVATSVDKLISSGAFCINDIRALVGEQLINEDWAWRHYITKNYTEIGNLDLLEKEVQKI